MKTNKYLYGYKIYLNYGQGWEYELFETTWKEARERLAEYRANCPEYPITYARGREINPDWNDPADFPPHRGMTGYCSKCGGTCEYNEMGNVQ